MNNIRVVISGGGTGGHIFPAIAIANEIKHRYPNAQILFVGANNRMEMERVPAAGYHIEGLDVVGLNRKQIWKNIPVLWKMIKSMNKAKSILTQFEPDIAIGVGGFASGPTLRKANSMGIPTLIQEQNSYAGVTNKLLAEKAKTICVAYEGMERFFSKDKIVLTGNPCRQDLLEHKATREEAAKHFNFDPNKKTVLVIGGSLGARTINKSLSSGLEEFTKKDIQVIWQCGQIYLFDLKVEMRHKTQLGDVRIVDFIDRMDLAYQIADLVVSRAGAGTISELSLLGKPAILVPSPNVAEDHQTQNALALTKKDAAILVSDADSEENLTRIAAETVLDDKKLASLAQNIQELALHNSAQKIVDEVIKIVEKKNK